MWERYYQAARISDALSILAEHGPSARIVAGATDLILEMERGVRTGITTLVDISRIAGLDSIQLDKNGVIHIGALVTHNECAASALVQAQALPLAQACWGVGSPQIRNRGTVAGNVITASPANDTITPLVALGAKAVLRSLRGERTVDLDAFYLGVRRTVMAPDEMLIEIQVPGMKPGAQGVYLKNALRKAQAISVVNQAVLIEMEDGLVTAASITAGAVAPTIIHLRSAEDYLIGKPLSPEVIGAAAERAAGDVRPIDDIRSSANFRSHISAVLTRRALKQITSGDSFHPIPERPILLRTPAPQATIESGYLEERPIVAQVNGQRQEFKNGHRNTLANLLRDEAGLTGTKIGCGEGECGACTVILDGMAVMSCLVPAPRAHGADILTVEGLRGAGDELHPVQQSFIDEGAVQCGYCTPGFVMSAVKLLEERPNPTYEEIQQAISGNLCRCTGYYSIIQAIEKAAAKLETAPARER